MTNGQTLVPSVINVKHAGKRFILRNDYMYCPFVNGHSLLQTV